MTAWLRAMEVCQYTEASLGQPGKKVHQTPTAPHTIPSSTKPGGHRGQPPSSNSLEDIWPFLPCRRCPGEAGEGPALKKQKKKITRIERLKEEHLPKRDKNPKQAEAEIPFIGPLPGPSHSRSVEIGAPQQAERSEEDTECMTIAYLNVMQRL